MPQPTATRGRFPSLQSPHFPAAHALLPLARLWPQPATHTPTLPARLLALLASLSVSGSLSLSCQRTRCMDERGRPISHDLYHAPLTFTPTNNDTAALLATSATYT